ncbi:uncharacterized protein [Periplaneta americana]|uniref:uncharacterized protein n=1 Tax=Periplaneta americana TaxID=6978 RepID=UPI0037E8DDF8
MSSSVGDSASPMLLTPASRRSSDRVDLHICTCRVLYKNSSCQRDGTLDPKTENAFNMNAKVVLYIALVLSGTQLTSAGLSSSALNSTMNAIANQINAISGQVQNAVQSAVDSAVTKLGDMEQQVQNQLQANFDNLANKGAAAQACLDNAKANVSSVIEKAKSQLKSFGVVEGIKILPWVGNVNKTKNKIEDVIANLTSGSKACLAQGSMFDLIGKAACEKNLFDSLNQTVSDISTEVQQEVKSGKTLLQAVLADAQKKIPPIIDSVITQLRTIKQTEVQCLATALFSEAPQSTHVEDA